MPTLLQLCNVGRIVGGTAACAWTVTRALPELEHRVVCFSPPDRETIEAFAPVPVTSATAISSRDVAELRADAVLLHNTPAARIVGQLPVPTLQYLHSAIRDPAGADMTVCCSRWLARRLGMPETSVLWQAVPKSAPLRRLRTAANRRKDLLVVGRICTPQKRKWPGGIVPFYARLAERCPHVEWEFVGCPLELQAALAKACRGQAVFHPAGWQQRALLATWDVLLYSNPSLPESFGRTTAEAMRVGCIPVVDRLGGFIEQIPDDGGFLCSSPDEFAAALEQLRDGDVRQAMSVRAECHADRWFSEERFALEIRTKWAALGRITPSP